MAAIDDSDPLDTLLNLEDQYYAEGHALGVADGSKAGRIEGRTFGMQKGFEKFSLMGDLAGQCALWEARMYESSKKGTTNSDGSLAVGNEMGLLAIQHSDRLQKHIATLAAVTELASLDTQNSEEAVADFDDRLKRAQAKAKIIASIVGEQVGSASSIGTSGSSKQGTSSNMEDFSITAKVSK